MSNKERETRSILTVDGTSSILFSMEMLLRRLEYRVDTARSGLEALRNIGRRLPWLVLSEAVLPDMSGPSLLERIKQNALSCSVPVIILTGVTDPGIREECMRLGCSAYLLKPVDPELLYATLQRASESVPRAHIRLTTSLPAVIGDGSALGGAARTEEVTAISEGGMYVKTRYPQPLNALTPVLVVLRGREIRAKAVVVHIGTAGTSAFQAPGMGLKFTEISDADRAMIRDFIREQLAADAASAGSAASPGCAGATGKRGRAV